MSEINLEIPIPTDADGFVLLQCPFCGEFFKLRAEDIKDEAVLEIWCPNCGLKAEEYFPSEVNELAKNMLENAANKIIYDGLKKLEENSKGIITFSSENQPKQKSEDALVPGIETLEIEHYKCCSKDAKINLRTKVTGSYCPFCGGIQDGNK